MKQSIDFSTVTEVSGYNVTKEQIQRLYSRYRFSAEFCKNKEVLEVACGSGQGLGYLAKEAKKVIGLDIDKNLLTLAQRHYQGRKNIKFILSDAQKLPFVDDSFDVLILHEAIYYLPNPIDFINEARRVLRNQGVIVISTVNKDWSGFNPSPYSYNYFSCPQLFALLNRSGFTNICIYGNCSIEAKNFKDKIVAFLKKIAVKFHLIPKTMHGKEFLKRIFFGKLLPMPYEIDDNMVEYIAPMLLSSDFSCYNYKVLYAVGYNSK